MTEKNRNPFTPEALATQLSHPELRHPFFDTTSHPNGQDCLEALNRVACMIELLNYLDPDNYAQDELTPEALSGHRDLMELLRETFTYSSRRLAILNRKRQKKHRQKARKKARYTAALLKSLTTLEPADHNKVLNAMATRLQLTRSAIDAFVVNAD